jgi:ferric-dicitrate binding protein FerR (iron transport regulator)
MTKTKPRCGLAMAVILSLLVALPADTWAGPQGAGQRAGEVSRTIPAVNIARGSKTIAASAKTPVDWQDLVNTQVNARARIALDDGSVLNVGSSSSLTVTQHNSAAQQTQLELTYGRMRSQVVKQAKPNAKFEVHTGAGVAGVVGTDFFLSYLNGLFQIVVFDGHVRFCNLDGQCVDVLAGMISTIRDGHQSPDQPRQSSPSELAEAVNATTVGLVAELEPPHGTSPWAWAGVVVAMVVVPAVAFRLVTRTSPPSTIAKQPIGVKNCPVLTAACP